MCDFGRSSKFQKTKLQKLLFHYYCRERSKLFPTRYTKRYSMKLYIYENFKNLCNKTRCASKVSIWKQVFERNVMKKVIFFWGLPLSWKSDNFETKEVNNSEIKAHQFVVSLLEKLFLANLTQSELKKKANKFHHFCHDC